MNRKDALTLVTELTKNQNLVKHMLAVEAIMRALARHFSEDEELWGIIGLLHDADYERLKDTPAKHPSIIFDELKKFEADPRIAEAIKAHAWGFSEIAKEPETRLEWSIFACDELSGLITACALVRPDKQLSSVTVESVFKKFPQKSFAKGVKRENIEYCESKLKIPLPEFIGIALSAMQGIHSELGL